MSRTAYEEVICGCGARLTLAVEEVIDAGRRPDLREAVYGGLLHRYRCDVCGGELVLDRHFLYVDLGRHQFLSVYPVRDLPQAAARASETLEAFPDWLRGAVPAPDAHLRERFLVRVCFGIDELREKLLLEEAGMTDLALEALKCQVLPAHPLFRDSEVVTLWLCGVAPDLLHFFPAALRPVDDRPPPPPGVSVDRALYDELAAVGSAELLRRRPELAAGPHVSLLRLVPWAAAP